jgi:hypothetical protein
VDGQGNGTGPPVRGGVQGEGDGVRLGRRVCRRA